MQIASALNNTIRILFNPKVEAFKLFDFLIVKSDIDRYLAQIIEIYDDKFDSSQNVAKLKLFYKIAPNNEVMPYDNFTPNKECEITKVKQEEIESFINQEKETFIFATNTKNSCALNIQYDFFNKNAIILADKIENSNAVTLNLAKKLSNKKNVVIIDSSGILELEGAKKIIASKKFRLPLNHLTINLIFDMCLSNASLEFQAIGTEIINEIKKFAKNQPDSFIPFNNFTKVLIEQYKATPYPELKLLLSKIKKCQMDDIFARNKKDYETLENTIEKNPITIIDISGLNSQWQKAYFEYIAQELKEDIYLIARINDENCDTDLINNIYNKKKNIKFIPNVSYIYKKLPTIMQYCHNYILMPSLYQRNDFLDANFALSNLISDGCIIFGDNTDNFIYLARDYELEIQEKRKNYKKIALSLIKEDGDYAFIQEETPKLSEENSQKILEELSNFENNNIEIQQKETKEQTSINEIEDFTENSKEINHEFQKDNEQDIFPDINENEATKEIQEDTFEAINNNPETNNQNEFNSDIEESLEASIDLDAITFENQEDTNNESEQLSENTQNNALVQTEDLNKAEENISQENNNPVSQVQETITISNSQEQENENISFSEEELDFFSAATKENQEETIEEDNVIIDDIEYKTKSDDIENISEIDDNIESFEITKPKSIENIEQEIQENKSNETFEQSEIEAQQNIDDELDLSKIANDSIVDNFNEIINTKNTENTKTLNLNNDLNVGINIDTDTKNIDNENLPIFKEELPENEENTNFQEGDIVIHGKYGRGEIIKIIQYDQRQLLQINFEESGKKLLDPKVAEITPEK